VSKQSGLGDGFYLDGYDLSGDIGSLGRIGGGLAGTQDVTGIDKSAMERLLLLADMSITLNGVFNDAANASHDVFKTVPSSSVAREFTLTVSGQTLGTTPLCTLLFTDYALTRAADGSLVFQVPGVLANGAIPTWTSA
jgi:hypothetical protein